MVTDTKLDGSKVTDRMAKSTKATKAKKPKRKQSTNGKSAKESKVTATIENNAQLKTTLQQIEKQFGEGSIMPLGSERRGPIQGISTGCLSLDLALGGPGFLKCVGPVPRGGTALVGFSREGIPCFVLCIGCFGLITSQR